MADNEKEIDLSIYDGIVGEALLKKALVDYSGSIALMSAFNPEDVILSYWISRIDANAPILFLDTKKHFPETLRYVDKLVDKLALTNVQILEPDPKLVQNTDQDGTLWQHQVNRCCWLRKVEPLNRAMNDANYKALITGRRRGQNTDRTELNHVEIDEDGRVKFNPLYDWEQSVRDAYMVEHDLPQHPLYELGYLSIGCAPCTTPVFAGEDARAGRWRHTRLAELKDGGKTECGLHVAQNYESNDSE